MNTEAVLHMFLVLESRRVSMSKRWEVYSPFLLFFWEIAASKSKVLLPPSPSVFLCYFFSAFIHFTSQLGRWWVFCQKVLEFFSWGGKRKSCEFYSLGISFYLISSLPFLVHLLMISWIDFEIHQLHLSHQQIFFLSLFSTWGLEK